MSRGFAQANSSWNWRQFDLGELIKEVVHRFAELHPDIPLMVRVNGAAAGIWDRFRIDQAVSNVISNAIKYGLRKPVTVVGLGRRQEGVRGGAGSGSRDRAGRL